MPSRVVTITSSKYLQVPKVVSHRKSRSRSNSRPRAVEVSESQPTVKARQPSPVPPPSTMADLHERRLSNGNMYLNGSYNPPTYGPSHDSTRVDYNNTCQVDSPMSMSFPTLDIPTMKVPTVDLNGDLYTLPPCPSPPPQRSLRDRLVGTWCLEEYIALPTPLCKIQRPTYPMTKKVTGLIMYTPDGYMSAHMLIPGQMSFKRGEGEEAQWAEAGKRSFCYAGPYYISNEGQGREETLRHTFEVCNLPGWLKDVQIRTWRFEEDDTLLVLGSEGTTEIKGDQRIPILTWRRARGNANGTPPAPTPQIKVSGPGEP